MKLRTSKVEFESLLLYAFMCFSMAIRGIFLIIMSDKNIRDSDFYTLIDAIAPIEIWGFMMLSGAVLVGLCVLSMSLIKYVVLVIGCLLGFIPGFGMVILGFIEGLNLYTPLQTGIIAFFNLTLMLYGGAILWIERKKIHTSQKSP